ncbi:MAG TPA: cyclase family protein [Sphingomicrobium sp.]|nr:cyclase family protein [Sphingomicrobium sp.]
MVRSALISIALLASAACAPEKPAELEGRWIDLSHDLAEDSPFWPTAEGFKHEVASYGKTPGGWFYSSYNLTLSEHGGTHLDAPIHFAEGKQTADQVPLDRLIGPAAVIDVSAASAANRDYRFTVGDLERWESANGRLPDGVILLFRTGFSKYWPDRKAYMGTDERGPEAVAKLHFPGLSAELARFLVTDRKVAAVGLDTPSLDYGQSKDFIVHRTLLGANIPGFENVANLEQMPDKGATVVALPVKIKDGSGAPLRIVARLP